MKKWICLLLVLTILGGVGNIDVNGGASDDDGKDWLQTVKDYEEGMTYSI